MFQFPIKKPSSANVVVAWLLFHISVYLTLTFDPVTLTLCQLLGLINIYHMCKYHQDPTIRSWFIIKNTRCALTACLTLTFDLVTLTLGQLSLLININQAYEFHQDLIFCSCFIGKPNFLHNCVFDLDLWPCDLDLVSTFGSHQYLSYV